MIYHLLTRPGKLMQYVNLILEQEVYRPGGGSWIEFRQFQGRISKRITALAVAMDDDKIIGWAMKVRKLEFVKANSDTYQIHTFVREDFRRQGIATKLVNMVGWDVAHEVDNSAAPQFFESLRQESSIAT